MRLLPLVLLLTFLLACADDGPASTPTPQSESTTTPSTAPVPTSERTSSSRTPTPHDTSTATPLPMAIPSPTPDFFYTGDWNPYVITNTSETVVGTFVASYEPSIEDGNPAGLTVTCVSPSKGDASFNVSVGILGYDFDPEGVDVQLVWDDGPTEFDTWEIAEWVGHSIAPQYSESYENYLDFIDRICQHDHLRIDIESVQGWFQAEFNISGFLGAYQPVRRECFPESIPPDFPTSPTGWTRLNFSQVQANRYDRESYSPAPQGVYLETLDEVSGDIYRFHVNCTNHGFEYFWSRITWIVLSPDEDTRRKLTKQFTVDELTIGVEIDGEVSTAQDWNKLWASRSYAGPGDPFGDVAILEFENIEDTYGLLMEMYRSDAKKVVFTLSGELYNARLTFDVTGFQEALQPIIDHCGI